VKNNPTQPEQVHTPEPWYTDESESRIFANPHDGWKKSPEDPDYVVGQMSIYNSIPTCGQMEANTRRIVTVINACTGLTEDEIVEAMRDWKKKNG